MARFEPCERLPEGVRTGWCSWDLLSSPLAASPQTPLAAAIATTADMSTPRVWTLLSVMTSGNVLPECIQHDTSDNPLRVPLHLVRPHERDMSLALEKDGLARSPTLLLGPPGLTRWHCLRLAILGLCDFRSHTGRCEQRRGRVLFGWGLEWRWRWGREVWRSGQAACAAASEARVGNRVGMWAGSCEEESESVVVSDGLMASGKGERGRSRLTRTREVSPGTST